MADHFRVTLWWDAVPLASVLIEGEMPEKVQLIPNQSYVNGQFQLHESTFLSVQTERVDAAGSL